VVVVAPARVGCQDRVPSTNRLVFAIEVVHSIAAAAILGISLKVHAFNLHK
jgi:hypothetical protein